MYKILKINNSLSILHIRICKSILFNQAYPTDEKPMSKSQGIVLRHLYLLLGYNQTERTFHTTPQRLR